MTSLPPARFNQVAISASDRERSVAFYRDLFGLTDVGGTTFSGAKTERVQGMPGASSTCAWLMDDRQHFQLEIFQFEVPRGRPYSAHRQMQDCGYSRLVFHVPDIFGPARRLGTPVVELHGKRTFLTRDPDGIAVQLIEAEVPRARLACVALSVPDLAIARRSFVDGCGCTVADETPPDWGRLWDEWSADKQMLLLDGSTIQLEISCYEAPEGASWPRDYRLADIGILNVALGFASRADIGQRLATMQAEGFTPNTPLVTAPGLFALTYSNDPQGFSVETFYVTALAAGAFGFRTANLFDRALMAIMKKAAG